MVNNKKEVLTSTESLNANGMSDVDQKYASSSPSFISPQKTEEDDDPRGGSRERPGPSGGSTPPSSGSGKG